MRLKQQRLKHDNTPTRLLGDALHDAGVLVEEVVPGHAGLARHARGDHHDVAVLEGGGHLVGTNVAGDLCRAVDVRNVGGDARSVDDIV